MMANHNALRYQMDGHGIDYTEFEGPDEPSHYRVNEPTLVPEMCRQIGECGFQLYLDPAVSSSVRPEPLAFIVPESIPLVECKS